MEEDKILEGNRLIAEFMGWTTHPEYGEDYVINKSKYRKVPYWSDCSYEAMREVLHYNSSWDWLMPVVEKIESLQFPEDLHFSVEINLKGCRIIRSWTSKSYENFGWHQTGYKIISTWFAVIEFIKWFNKCQK